MCYGIDRFIVLLTVLDTKREIFKRRLDNGRLASNDRLTPGLKRSHGGVEGSRGPAEGEHSPDEVG